MTPVAPARKTLCFTTASLTLDLDVFSLPCTHRHLACFFALGLSVCEPAANLLGKIIGESFFDEASGKRGKARLRQLRSENLFRTEHYSVNSTNASSRPCRRTAVKQNASRPYFLAIE